MQVKPLGASTVTNSYGYFSLTVPAGNYILQFRNLGYKTLSLEIRLGRDTVLTVELDEEIKSLREVSVQADKASSPTAFEHKNISIKQIKESPTIFGEPDVVKVLQLQPGVKTMGDGSSGLFVRGGNRDQNIMLIDEAPVYNISHLFGYVSVFNPDIVKDVKFYSAHIPASYGGRLSSVVDTRMKEGNLNKFSLSGGLSYLAGRLTAEGPLIKNKSSFILSARRSYLDAFMEPSPDNRLVPTFYDVNGKVNIKLNKNNRLLYSFFHGSDVIESYQTYHNKLINTSSTLRWNHLLNQKVFLNTSLIYSNYSNRLIFLEETAPGEPQKTGWLTGVRDYNGKVDVSWFINPASTVEGGLNTIYHQFTPGSSELYERDLAPVNALEHGIYLSHELLLSQKLGINYGLRFSLFQNVGESSWYTYEEHVPVAENHESGGVWNSYHAFEPRLLFTYQADRNHTFRAGYSRNAQYMQILSNTSLAYTTFETWFPANPNVAPLIGDNFSISYSYNKPENRLSLSTEVYYKHTTNQIDYIDHAVLVNNPFIEGEIREGEANAFGGEVSLSKGIGKLEASLSYVYSRVFYHIPGITQQETYRAPYDIPHDLKLFATYTITPRLSVSTFWTYTSGRAATIPTGAYVPDPIFQPGFNKKMPLYYERNGSSFPDYHRLDVSLQYNFPTKGSYAHTLTAGVYNLYARKNPLKYDFFMGGNLVNVEYFFTLIPNVSYSFKIN